MSEQQTLIPAFDHMNRYDDRTADWPSTAVYERPRRTLANGWRKFHADRDCGRGKLHFVEQNSHRPTSEKYAYAIRCWECGYRVPEEEILFIGGDWWDEHGVLAYEQTLEKLFLPPERVLELGPDPDEDELIHALRLSRIERDAGPFAGGPLRLEQWPACEDCGHMVPILFDDGCRMCYDGEWTERMQDSVNALERKIREWHNGSFVHRLGQKVDPLSINGRAYDGQMLWRRHATESVAKLVEVKQCLKDDADGHWEYVLTDPTHTDEWRYHEADLADCFWDTGLYNDDQPKPVMDDRIRAVYQRVCEHSFSTVHDAETGDPVGMECIHCRVPRSKVEAT